MSETGGIERLLEHRAWVRDLARRLVRDEASARDLEQEVWASALAHPPRHDRSLAGWLARLVRHRARDAARSERRRSHYETSRPIAADEASPDILLARLEEEKRVVRAVEALAEPYREAILLRWFEDLPPREIARRTGTPVETVHTRLRRGLERLRATLDEEHGGDGRRWILALLPVAGVRRASAATGLLPIAAALVAATAFGMAIVLGRAGEPTTPPPSPAPEPPAVAASAGEPTAAPVPAPARAASRATAPLAPTGEGRVAVTGTVRTEDPDDLLNPTSVVLRARGPASTDPGGTGLPGPRVDGRFLVHVPAGDRTWLIASAPGYFPAVVSVDLPAPGAEPARAEIVLRRRPRIAGVLRLPNGEPAVAAPVGLHVRFDGTAEEFAAAPDAGMVAEDGGVFVYGETIRTDEGGRFALDLPAPGEATLLARPVPGCGVARLELGRPGADRTDVEVRYPALRENRVLFTSLGKPLGDAVLWIRIDDSPARPRFAVAVDDDGFLPADLLAAGTLCTITNPYTLPRTLCWTGSDAAVELPPRNR